MQNLDYQRGYFEREPSRSERIQPADSPYVRRHLDRTIDRGNLRPGQDILEVGAGMGRFTSLLIERGLDVTASDLAPHLLDAIGQRHPDVITVASDIADIAERTETRFDRATGFFMLHHLEDFRGAFSGIRRALRPGGRIAFCDVNAYCALYYLQIAFTPSMTWAGDGGVRHMRPGVVIRALEAEGFEDVAFERYGFLPPFAYNRGPGRLIDHALGRLGALEPVRAFQIITGRAPG